MTLTVEAPITRGLNRTRGVRALTYLPACAVVIDLVAILIACTIAISGRDAFGTAGGTTISETLGTAGPLIVLGWIVAIALVGGYDRGALGAGPDEFKRVLRGSTATAAVVGIACYLAKFQLSRGFFLLAFTIGIPLLIISRCALRGAVHSTRRRGNLCERVVISGTPEHVDEIAAVLSRESWLGYQVVGAVTNYPSDRTPQGVGVLGSPDNLREIVDQMRADVVFFADGSLSGSGDLRDRVYELEDHDVQVVVAPSVADTCGTRVKVRPVGGLPLIHIEKPRTVQASRWAKRAFDLAGASALLVAFAPVIGLAMLRVWAHDRGPVFFSQTRIGRGGQEFGCLKLRTMVTDAEALLHDLRAERGADALLFKLQEDPRITRPGRWLRRYSLDELPQLINVLRGDMSLVGPRPQVADEVACYRDHTQRRLLVRPGMTGLWQVSGRSDLSAEQAVRMDVYYVDNWSMTQDLTILARTLGAVLGSRGAY